VSFGMTPPVMTTLCLQRSGWRSRAKVVDRQAAARPHMIQGGSALQTSGHGEVPPEAGMGGL
jgi:hypothetical protein